MIAAAIVAASSNDVIGLAGALPWYLPEDLRRFKALTTGHVVVMGRVTHDSILARLGRPLPGRMSIVISRTPCDQQDPQVRFAASVEVALAAAAGLGEAAGNREFFLIGGESVLRQAMPSVDRVYLTRIHQVFDGDRVLPAGWLDGFTLRARTDGVAAGTEMAYSFLDYWRAAS